MRLTRLAAVAVLALVARPALAADTIPNPEFNSWSKFKKGTSVTMKVASVAAEVKSEIVTTTTLVEVAADKLVLETESAIKINGMEIKMPAEKRDVLKTLELPEGTKKEDVTAGKPPGATEEGTETLKISGVEVKTKCYKYSGEVAGTKTESKVRVTAELPGTMVKSVTTATGASTSTTTVEVTAFKKP